MKSSKKINWKIIIYSLVGLGFLALTYLLDWIFIVGAVIMIWLNHREMNGKR